MRSFISYRLLSLAAAIVISLLPVTASASTAAHVGIAVHAGTSAGIQQPSNIAWD